MKRRHSLAKILVMVFVLFLAGCVSTPKKYEPLKKSGQWEAKLRIQDLKQRKTYNLSLDVIAERPSLLRAEVSGTLGISVASVLVNGNDVRYAVHRKKEFFLGPATDQALLPVLQVNFNPAYLVNLFFDEPIGDINWDCQMTPENLANSCIRSTDKLTIQWLDRQGENKRMLIKGNDFEIQVVVKDFQTKVVDREKAFVLSIPDGYRTHKLD